MGRSRNYVVLLTVLALAMSACGGGETEGEDTTTVPSTSAVDDVTTTEAMVTTTTAAVTTTTTVAAFDLGSLDDVTLNSVNWNCAWAKDETNPNTNAPFTMTDQLRNEILAGFAIEPFIDATASIDVDNDDELKQAIGQACDEIGAPTEEFLNSF